MVWNGLHVHIRRGLRADRLAILIMVYSAISFLSSIQFVTVQLPETNPSGLVSIREQSHQRKLIHSISREDVDNVFEQNGHRNLRSHLTDLMMESVKAIDSTNLVPPLMFAKRYDHSPDTERENSSNSTAPILDLPLWMTQYFHWHQNSLQRLNSNHSCWQEYKYLVLRCLEMDTKCGGASDRLQGIPVLIQLAAQYGRLFFIEWEKPAALSSFLDPVQIDWRIPEWLIKSSTSSQNDKNQKEMPYMLFQRSPAVLSDKHFHRLNDNKETIMLDMRYQTTDHGRGYYNAHIATGEPDFDQIYTLLWASLFQPAPAVQQRILQTKQDLGLGPSTQRYNSLHIRSMYYKDKSQKKSRIESAVNCAYSELHRKLGVHDGVESTLYIASDSAVVLTDAVRFGSNRRVGHIVTANRAQNATILHLDRGSVFLDSSEKASNWRDFPVDAYFDTFVDLYLLSGAQCVVYNNVGGYGRWASRIANHTCAVKLQNNSCNTGHNIASDEVIMKNASANL